MEVFVPTLKLHNPEYPDQHPYYQAELPKGRFDNDFRKIRKRTFHGPGRTEDQLVAEMIEWCEKFQNHGATVS